MDITNTIGLLHLMVAVLPGFLFLLSYGYETKNTFKYLMLSIFWGICVAALIETLYLISGESESFQELLRYPYAAGLTFSICGLMLGRFIRWVKEEFNKRPSS